MTNGSLMKVKSIAEWSPWSILQYFWPALSHYRTWKSFLVILRVAILHRFYRTCIYPIEYSIHWFWYTIDWIVHFYILRSHRFLLKSIQYNQCHWTGIEKVKSWLQTDSFRNTHYNDPLPFPLLIHMHTQLQKCHIPFLKSGSGACWIWKKKHLDHQIEKTRTGPPF